jgi:hypothetical protein
VRSPLDVRVQPFGRMPTGSAASWTDPPAATNAASTSIWRCFGCVESAPRRYPPSCEMPRRGGKPLITTLDRSGVGCKRASNTDLARQEPLV